MSEPLRLAPFLRESCARNLYGLVYLDPEQSLLRIPWPVAPKQCGGIPPGFEIYHDWAVRSKQKRNRDPCEQIEPPTSEKHRFRNALAKANGIKYRDDIKISGARVYQFVGNQQQPLQSRQQGFPASPPGYTASPPAPRYSAMLPVPRPTGFEREVFPAENYSNCFGTPVNHELSLQSGSPCETLTATPSVTPPAQTFEDEMSDIIGYVEKQELEEGQIGLTADAGAVAGTSHAQQDDSQVWSLTDLLELAPEDSNALEVKVCFRQEDASRSYITENGGCRLYFGQNVPNLSQMLEKDHLDHIMKMFRHEKDHYFGPETWQQIQLPLPNDYMRSPVQQQKTEAILANMERGLLLYIDRTHQSMYMNIPDVYAMRLCQTRIFPCHENASNGNGFHQESNSLERMKWTKVFDGKGFIERFVKVTDQYSIESYPSSSFSLSLGQRPSNEKPTQMFVSLTVTVQRAQQLIQNRMDCDQEVCISGINTSDAEANTLAHRLAQSLRLQQSGKVY